MLWILYGCCFFQMSKRTNYVRYFCTWVQKASSQDKIFFKKPYLGIQLRKAHSEKCPNSFWPYPLCPSGVSPLICKQFGFLKFWAELGGPPPPATPLVHNCTIFLCSLDVGNIDDQSRGPSVKERDCLPGLLIRYCHAFSFTHDSLLLRIPDHWVTRPKNFIETDTETFFRDQNFRDRDFFWDQIFSRLIPRLFFET